VQLTLCKSGVLTGGNYAVEIWDHSGVGGAPGSKVGTIADGKHISVLEVKTLAPCSPVTFSNLSLVLDPDTTYWVVVRGDSLSLGDLHWDTTPDMSGTGAPTHYAVTATGGVLWSGLLLDYRHVMAVTAQSPTQLVLEAWSARAAPGPTVRLAWTTANEVNVIGFNVWRKSGNGEWKVLNKTQILAKQAGMLAGGKYTRTDKTAKQGKVYQYKLEIVLSDGHSSWSDVKRVVVK
jgi:hypothetical protein